MSRNSEFVQDLKNPRKYVVFENDFSTGMEGWAGLIEAGTNYYPSLNPQSHTGPHSMIIDTRGGVQNVTAHAAKRMAAFEGVWNIHYRIGWNASNVNFLYQLKLILDWQYRDTARWWPELVYTHYDEDEAGVVATWHVSRGFNSQSLSGYHEITALSGHEFGYNQANKIDYFDITLSFMVDRDKALWRYVDINGQRFTLTESDGSPLVMNNTGQTPTANFDNGANTVISVRNRPTNSSADPYALLDYIRVEWEGI